MSGPLCPDCGGTDLEYLSQTLDDGSRSMKCTLCGWSGPEGPRRSLPPEGWARISQRSAQLKERRASGLLYFVRVFAEQGVLLDLAFKVFDVVGIQEAKHGVGYILIEMNRRPTAEEIHKIELIDGVTKVTVF